MTLPVPPSVPAGAPSEAARVARHPRVSTVVALMLAVVGVLLTIVGVVLELQGIGAGQVASVFGAIVGFGGIVAAFVAAIGWRRWLSQRHPQSRVLDVLGWAVPLVLVPACVALGWQASTADLGPDAPVARLSASALAPGVLLVAAALALALAITGMVLHARRARARRPRAQ